MSGCVGKERSGSPRKPAKGPILREQHHQALKVPHVAVMLGDYAKQRLIALKRGDDARPVVVGGNVRRIDDDVVGIGDDEVGHIDEVNLRPARIGRDREIGRYLLRQPDRIAFEPPRRDLILEVETADLIAGGRDKAGDRRGHDPHRADHPGHTVLQVAGSPADAPDQDRGQLVPRRGRRRHGGNGDDVPPPAPKCLHSDRPLVGAVTAQERQNLPGGRSFARDRRGPLPRPRRRRAGAIRSLDTGTSAVNFSRPRR